MSSTATQALVEACYVDRAFVITLNRPPANALGLPLLQELSERLDEFERGDARVLVLSSNLPGFFAAGADIKLMGGLDTTGFVDYTQTLRSVIEGLARSDRPCIAAVEGRALGGGLELALAASLRVAGKDARFGLPEPRLGLIAGAGGTQRLPGIVGRSRALDLMLTAREVAADEALAIGLVDRLVPAGEATAAALELAATLATMSGPALTAVLRCVEDAYDRPLPEGLCAEAARVSDLFANGDAQEGIRAFLERRPPHFP
jgi:enoyl-CoA hydratase